jgi:hypothetical protein
MLQNIQRLLNFKSVIIKCGFCGKEKSVVRMSTKDIVPDFGWVCADCLTAEPLPLNLGNKDKKEGR